MFEMYSFATFRDWVFLQCAKEQMTETDPTPGSVMAPLQLSKNKLQGPSSPSMERINC